MFVWILKKWKCYVVIKLTFLKVFDVNKTCASKECINNNYWYFLDKGFEFQSDVCNECHDVFNDVYEF